MTKRKRGRGRGAGRSPSTSRSPSTPSTPRAVAGKIPDEPEDSPSCKKTLTLRDGSPEVNLRKRSCLDVSISESSPMLKRTSRRITGRISLIGTSEEKCLSSEEKCLSSEKESILSEEPCTEVANKGTIVGKRLKLVRNTNLVIEKEDSIQINLKTFSKAKNVKNDEGVSKSLNDQEAVSEVTDEVNLPTKYDEICSSTEKESNLSGVPSTKVINLDVSLSGKSPKLKRTSRRITEKISLIDSSDEKEILFEKESTLSEEPGTEPTESNLSDEPSTEVINKLTEPIAKISKTPVQFKNLKKIESPLKSLVNKEAIQEIMEVDQVSLTDIENAVGNDNKNSTNVTQSTESLTTSPVKVSPAGSSSDVEVISVDLCSEKNVKHGSPASFNKAMKNIYEEDEVEEELIYDEDEVDEELIYEDLNDQGEKDNPINIDDDDSAELSIPNIKNMGSILCGINDDNASNLSPKSKIVIKIPQGTVLNKPKTQIGIGEEQESKKTNGDKSECKLVPASRAERCKIEAPVTVIDKLKTTDIAKIKSVNDQKMKPSDDPDSKSEIKMKLENKIKIQCNVDSEMKFEDKSKINSGDKPKTNYREDAKTESKDSPKINVIKRQKITMEDKPKPVTPKIKLSDTTKMQVDEEANMSICDEPINLDIEFNDLDLEKEFWTETSLQIEKEGTNKKDKDSAVTSKKTPVVPPKKAPLVDHKKTPVISPKIQPVTVTKGATIVTPIKEPVVISKKDPVVISKKDPVVASKREPIVVHKKESAPKIEPASMPKKKLITAPPNKQAIDVKSGASDISQPKKTTPGKPGATHILGLSFIIGIKGEDKPKFDCVLCNQHSSTFNGPAMHAHVKSRKHIINAMEVQNFLFFEKYKNDQQIATDKLLQILTDYEKAGKKQHLAVATTETYLNVRKKVEENIANIKEKLRSNVANENVATDIDRFKEIVAQGAGNMTRKHQDDLIELINSVEMSVDLSSEKSRNKSKEQSKPLISETLMDRKKANDKNPKFEKVVIMANSLYEPILHELANENIIIMAEEDLSCSQLKKYVLKKKGSISSNTLWLSTTGIFGIATQETTKICLSKTTPNCLLKPLNSLIPCLDMMTLSNAAKVIKELTDVMTTTIRDIKLSMGPNSSFMVIPPIPVSVVDESSFPHMELHSFIQKHPNYYVASKANMHHLSMLFEMLSKEIRAAARQECKLPNKSASSCYNSDYSIDMVNKSNIPKKCSFEIWKEMILNLIRDVLTTGPTEDSNVSDSKNKKDEALDFHSSRVVIFDEEKFDNKRKVFTKNKELSEKPKSAQEELSNSGNDTTKFFYDHIVFIGTENIVKQAINLSKSSSTPPWIFFEIRNPVNWTEFLKQCNDWRSTTKSYLFVFVPDLSMVAKEINDTQCSRWNCKEYLNHMSLSLVGSRVSEFQSLVNGIADVCSSKSKLILTPICPRVCIQKATLEDKPAHTLLHQVIIHKSNPLLLEGTRNKWIEASDSLERAWKVTCNKIQEHHHSAIDVSCLIEEQKKIKPLDWKLPSISSLDCASPSEQIWLKCLEDAVFASLKNPPKIEIKPKRDSSPIFIKEITRPKVVASDVRNEKGSFGINQNASIYTPASSFQPHQQSESVQHGSVLNSQFLQPFNQFVPTSQFSQPPPNFLPYNQTPHNMESIPNQAISMPKLDQSSGNFSGYQGSPIISNMNYPMQSTIAQPPHILTQPPPPINRPATEFPRMNSDQSNSSSVQQYKDANLNKSYEEFISSLANVCDSFKQPPIFERVVFIGKRELIDPLTKINVVSTAIYHNLANVEESDTQSILLKLGTIRPRTLCCLIFGLSVITKAQPISNSCTNFNCRQPVPITVLKSFNKKGRELYSMSQGDIISNRLQSVMSFVKRLGTYVPVIVLPLYPSRVYCDDGKSVASHNITHALNGQDNYVVSGTDIVWEQNFLSLTRIWNNMIDGNHREFQSSALVTKYIEKQPTVFLIKDKVNDFFAHWAEPTVWKTFSEAVVQSLVLLKSGTSAINESVKEKAQLPIEIDKTINQRKSRFSTNMKDPNASASIKIWKFSDSIPEAFFTDLFKAIDANCRIKTNSDNYVVEFGKRNGAELLVSKLNGCQLCDTTLRAEIIGEEDEKINLNKIQETYITSIFNQIYTKWKFAMTQNLKKKINSVMDVTTFKTTKCLGNCEGPDRCVYYHSFRDKRRNPLQFKYSQKMCNRPRNALGNCSLGDSCTMSHNTYEQMFFPTNFQTISCPSNTPQRQCFKKPLCKFAHIDTPEMFYNPQWEDLVVFGTENTLSYFCGAIRSLSKVNLNKCDFKVLLISQSLEFLDLVENVISGITQNHRVKVVTLTNKWIDLESYQVILATPSALASSQNQIFNANRGGAIIVDDVKKILTNISDSEAVVKFIHKIKLSTASENNVNKVFVSSIYDDKITGVVSRYSGLKLKEVKEPEDTPLIVLEDSPGPPSVHRSNVKSKSPRPYSPPKRTRSPLKRTRSRSRSRSRDRNRNQRYSRDRDSNVYSRNKRSRTKSPISSKNNKKFQPEKSTVSPPKQLSSGDDELRQKLGQQLFNEYLKEETETREKFEEEYKVFKDVSELHPDYEIYFEDFITKYNIKHEHKGEKHKETLWHQFWNVKFPEIKQSDWNQLKKELVKSYESKSLNLKSAQFTSNGSSVGSSMTTDPDVFSVEKTLNLLEELCSKLGMLGPALKAMIMSARKFGINTKQGLDVFIDSENMLLVNMVLDKLKNIQLESPRNMIGTYERAISWTGKLLEAAKKGPQNAARPLDLNAIAQASFGKDMGFVVQLIKAALNYEGTSQPSKELINDLYLKVCSLHFNMAMT